MRGALSNRNTIDSTVTGGHRSIKSNRPGPGSYNIQRMFPKGQSYVIQGKQKHDSFLLTKISQNISPGPAKYTNHGPVGGTH